MTLQLLRSFFMWCSVISTLWLLITSLICLKASGWIYQLHGRWFVLSRETFDTVLYSFLALFKILVIVFNIVPWIALCIIR
jgi:hypothetical protein